MAQTELTCNTIGDLDGGRARLIVNAALAAIYADLEDRGEDEKERVLDVKLTFVKKKGNLAIDVTAAAKTPKYRSNATIAKSVMKQKKNGKGTRPAIEFQEHAADNPDQVTFPEMDRDDD